MAQIRQMIKHRSGTDSTRRIKMSSTDIEKENLEAHVELCAERYKTLENKLADLDQRMTKVEEHVLAIREAISNKTSGADKQLIAIGTTIFGVMFSAIIGLLIHLATK